MLKEITIVTQYFAPAWGYGGPPKILYTLAKALIERGMKVNVVTTDVLDEGRNKSSKEVLDKIEIFRYRTLSNYAAYKTKLIFAPQILSQSKEIIERSDLVLFSDLRAIINWQIFPYVIKRNIPYGVFVFGEIPYGEGIKSVIKRIFDKLWVLNFINNAKYRFVQTPHEQKMYQEVFSIPNKKTHFLPLPLKIKEFDIQPKKLSDFHKKYNLNSKDSVLLFVGRLNYLKGVDLLINAVIPLINKDKKIKLIIIGRDDGAEFYLKSLIPPELHRNIIFTGPIYGEDCLVAYVSASCFILTPRFYEETSLASLEALSTGTPVIVTKQADIPNLERYDAGLVIENASDTIQAAILKMLDKISKEEPSSVKQKCQLLIKEIYDSEKVVDRLLKYIKNEE